MADALDPVEPEPWWDEVVLPALLGSARHTYGQAMRAALRRAGFDDVPPRGIGLVGGIARNGPAAEEDLPRFLSTSKRSAGQLVDALVERGYLERSTDADRLTLTDRGRQAAALIAGAHDRVDAALAHHVSPADLATTRRVLGTLNTLGERARERAATEGR